MNEQIMAIVLESIAELNEALQYDELEQPDAGTPLFGGEEGIDSLSLVMLITAVEARVNDSFGAAVTLASEKAMSMRNSPYRSVGSLVAFIEQELGLGVAV